MTFCHILQTEIGKLEITMKKCHVIIFQLYSTRKAFHIVLDEKLYFEICPIAIAKFQSFQIFGCDFGEWLFGQNSGKVSSTFVCAP